MLGRPASAGTTERSLSLCWQLSRSGSLDTHTKALKLRQVYTRLSLGTGSRRRVKSEFEIGDIPYGKLRHLNKVVVLFGLLWLRSCPVHR